MMRKTQLLSDSQMRVSYLEAGEGAPLVLLHGVGMNAASWYPQIEALSRDFRVIAVDMPGHGESEAFTRPVTLTDYVAWLSDFLRTRPEARFAVAGHSMGALITAGLAIDHSEQVSHAIVMSGVYRRSETARRAVLQRARELAAGEALLDSPLARWFSDDAHEAALREQVGGWLSQVNLQGYAAAYQAFADGDRVYADRWQEMRCPVLVLTGELDANSNPQMAREMAAAAPQGRAVIILGARHMVSLTDAPRVNHEMLSFLRYGSAVQGNRTEMAGFSYANR
ncbi:alpha/beta hydrolase [Serratia ficaria]|uniref:Carboxylesterase ybfK n=1 Tax=Serratia ficaria TaxID=61651 RepID=A0A240C8M8_SERFI|nr:MULTISPECIES: alpha/beta hydrolase [Serratia]MEE4481461.1 alpha/beta hydrolase [Serratia ficaria]REF43937.1 pimeloyl-ACP methyl ester carboxylesterase [Serratia ficaria]CAI0721489.1 Carboxylesterase ybfK [Serratia ficaria]CAI0723166.1 Carboxylesterase ybfK [Serratia ficaria]CAI0741673.1 Carboxylesterase ybfK [Serratia ficaria]